MNLPEDRLLAKIETATQETPIASESQNTDLTLEVALERIPGSVQAFLMDRLQGYFTHVKL